MKRSGFTLIELLAVIVILAIIALIATPIILGIINDAKEESNERSVELYASAVRNAVAAYQLTGLNAPKSFSDLTIQYDGDVKCTVQELYEDGSFYLDKCKVNNGTKEYSYGKESIETPESGSTQFYKPQYYNVGVYVGQTVTSENLLTEPPTGKNFYVGYDVEDGEVSTAYVCFIRYGIEYCLKSTRDDSELAKNIEIIKDAYSDVVDTDACSFNTENYYVDCKDQDFSVLLKIEEGQIRTNTSSGAYCDEEALGSISCDWP